MATTKKSSQKKKAADKSAQTKREVWGVVIIALGLFLGASMYSDAVGILGKAVSGFLFGLFGIVGYAIPVCIIAAGVLLIVFSEGDVDALPALLGVISLIAILTIIHIARRGDTIENIKALAYYKDAYDLGFNYREGGGIIGALLAYPSLLLIGRIGSYILFIACIMVSFLLITHLSIKNAGTKLGQTIRTGVSNANERIAEHKQNVRAQQQQLYTENITEEVLSGAPVTNKKKTSKQTSAKNSKKASSFESNIFTLDSSFNQKNELAAETAAPIRKSEPVRPTNDEDEGPEFIPSKGQIRKRAAKEKAIDKAFDKLDEETVNTEYYHEFQPDEDNRIVKNAPAKDDDTAIPVYEPIIETAAEETPAVTVDPEPEQDEDIPTSAAPVIDYQRPPYSLLNSPASDMPTGNESPQEKAKLLIETLATFNIPARIINISVGPVITRFELQPAQGIRVNRITSLSQDIALALAAPLVRIEAPIPGKAAIGIEIPNKNAAQVLLREVIESKEFQSERSPISFALGKDIAGRIVCANLEKMPHLLIAGATGSGKSVCINDILLSMVYKASPSDLRLVLIDPKVVEMRVYAPLPHLMLPVVTDPKKAAGALKWAVLQMEQRYQSMAKVNARDLARYNALVDESERLPKLVIVIDELADLMMVAAKDVEDSICRIAQLGRAAGVHLIVATQRPSTDIITGLIKANIPSRIAFAVSSGVDSRVILDTTGAEKLLGKGDMLFHANGASKPIRAQGAFVSDEEVERVMDFFAQTSSQPPLEEEAFDRITNDATQSPAHGNGKQEDELLPEAVRIVMDSGQASISMIQRRLRVGYARAARLIDIMEQQKIVSGFDGSKARKLLIDRAEFERRFGNGAPVANDDISDDTECEVNNTDEEI